MQFNWTLFGLVTSSVVLLVVVNYYRPLAVHASYNHHDVGGHDITILARAHRAAKGSIHDCMIDIHIWP